MLIQGKALVGSFSLRIRKSHSFTMIWTKINFWIACRIIGCTMISRTLSCRYGIMATQKLLWFSTLTALKPCALRVINTCQSWSHAHS